MNRVLAIGGGLTAAGLVGYGVGVLAPYPGRALSVTILMAGIALVAVGGGGWRR